MKTVYIADDGKQFFNEKECAKYEAELLSTLFMYDFTGNRTYNFDACLFLRCVTKNIALSLWNKYNGLILPWEYEEDVCAGTWFWDENEHYWRSIDQIKDILKTIQKIGFLD